MEALTPAQQGVMRMLAAAPIGGRGARGIQPTLGALRRKGLAEVRWLHVSFREAWVLTDLGLEWVRLDRER